MQVDCLEKKNTIFSAHSKRKTIRCKEKSVAKNARYSLRYVTKDNTIVIVILRHDIKQNFINYMFYVFYGTTVRHSSTTEIPAMHTHQECYF